MHHDRTARIAWLDEGGTRVLVVSYPLASRPPSLSAAEWAVARAAAAGLRNREIALARGSSPRTVAHQLAAIYAKLGIRGRHQLAGALAAERAR